MALTGCVMLADIGPALLWRTRPRGSRAPGSTHRPRQTGRQDRHFSGISMSPSCLDEHGPNASLK